MRSRWWRGAAVGVLLMTGTACGADGGGTDGGGTEAEPSPRPTTSTTTSTTTTAAPTEAGPVVGESIVAEATIPVVPIHDEPGGEPSRALDHPTDNGGPLVFLVVDRRDGWLHVQLPIRPNGSTGWIRTDDVALTRHAFHITVDLADHRLRVTEDEAVVLDEPVGIGTEDTPTPGGEFYVAELLRPPDPDGPYGPYAYGLSGFSNELTSFAGGDGVIGIHGTDRPDLVGTDVSHGCIRLDNQAITRLVAILPLGVPVEIRA